MLRAISKILFSCGISLWGLSLPPTLAEELGAPPPGLWDPNFHLERPGLSGLRAIRFLTEDDNPPLNFALSDGAIAGFNVDIARAICEELQVACTVQARRWDTMANSLLTGKGDAIIAALAPTAGLREKLDFTQPYYKTPARFATLRGAVLPDISPTGLARKKIGVIAGSAHLAYLQAFFPLAIVSAYPDASALREALRKGNIDALFGDGLTLAVWLSGASSADCCVFAGGPYTESRYFGEGVGIAVRKEDMELRRALDWALARLWSHAVYSEIFLKNFPISFYEDGQDAN
jgi:polar amino acid transport system substrate-binding protein